MRLQSASHSSMLCDVMITVCPARHHQPLPSSSESFSCPLIQAQSLEQFAPKLIQGSASG